MKKYCVGCKHEHFFASDVGENGAWICSDIHCFCRQIEELNQIRESYKKYTESIQTIHDKIKWLLENIPAFRELENKQFIFAFWHYEHNFCPGMVLDMQTFVKLEDPETIRRAKQKIVENNPDLGPTNDKLLIEKACKKGALEEWIVAN